MLTRLIQISAAALILSACTPPQVVEYTSFQDRSFAARGQPASYHKESAQQLLDSGHILIGFIDLRKNIQKCYENNQCTRINDDPMSQQDLAAEAAARGGDLISLLEDRRILEKTSKQVCTNTSVQTYYVNDKLYTTTVCTAYATYHGFLEATITRALIWRHEPALANPDNNFRAMKQAMESLAKTYNVKVPHSREELQLAKQQRKQEILDQLGLTDFLKLPDKATASRQSDKKLQRIQHTFAQSNRGKIQQLIDEPWAASWTDAEGRNLLMWALFLRNQAAANLLLDRHQIDINSTDVDGNTVLSYAVLNDIKPVSKRLISLGARLDQTDKYGFDLIKKACFQNRPEVINWLVKKGLNVNAPNENGVRAVHLCALRNNLPVLLQLQRRGADMHVADQNLYNVLHYAAIRSDQKMINTLARQQVNVSARDQYGNTPLFYAAKYANLSAWKTLIKHGASPIAENNNNKLPIYYAFAKKHWRFITMVLEQDNKLIMLGNARLAALNLAIEHKQAELARLLFSRGVRIQRDKAGSALLLTAARHADNNMIHLLAKYETNLNQTTINNMTPLMAAAYYNNHAAVAALLEHQVNTSQTDHRGMTALRYATQKGHSKIVTLLREAGVRD